MANRATPVHSGGRKVKFREELDARADDVRGDFPASSGRSGGKGRHAHPSFRYLFKKLLFNKFDSDAVGNNAPFKAFVQQSLHGLTTSFGVVES